MNALLLQICLTKKKKKIAHIASLVYNPLEEIKKKINFVNSETVRLTTDPSIKEIKAFTKAKSVRKEQIVGKVKKMVALVIR